MPVGAGWLVPSHQPQLPFSLQEGTGREMESLFSHSYCAQHSDSEVFFFLNINKNNKLIPLFGKSAKEKAATEPRVLAIEPAPVPYVESLHDLHVHPLALSRYERTHGWGLSPPTSTPVAQITVALGLCSRLLTSL